MERRTYNKDLYLKNYPPNAKLSRILVALSVMCISGTAEFENFFFFFFFTSQDSLMNNDPISMLLILHKAFFITQFTYYL